MLSTVFSSLLWAGCSPPPCNGSVAACHLPLPDVVFPGAHNAMSNAEQQWILPNQVSTPATQLASGVRAMLVDTYAWEGGLWTCHGYCELGATPLVSLWQDIASFLADHPREVVLLVVQDAITPADHEASMREAGLWPFVYPWPDRSMPTLGELIELNQRLVFTVESTNDLPPWSPPFYELGYDTPYGFSDVDAMRDDAACDVLRGDPDHELFLINHWVSNPFPNIGAATVANQAATLDARIDACRRRWGRYPTVLAVDFAQLGDVVQTARRLNGP